MFKKYVFIFAATTLLTLASVMNGIAASGNGGGGDGFCKGKGAGERNCIYDGIPDRSEAYTLTQEEEAHLLFMREEEKLARDAYDAFYLSYGRLIFDNISDAEQNHMDALKNLLDRNSLDDPILGVGLFADPELQARYDELMLFASDPTKALIAGARIEEMDFVDIQHAIENTEPEEVVSTYESLLCGSGNHLRAFIRQLEAISVEYEPLGEASGGLEPDEFWAIAHSDMERGCGNRDDDKGYGKGRT